MTDPRPVVRQLLEAIGAATVLVVGFYLAERYLGWDPVAAAERLLEHEPEEG